MTGAVVGVDLGTQSIRVTALDTAGGLLASAAAPLTSIRDGDRHEQDPKEWLTTTTAALRRVTSALPPGTAVRGIAVSGTSGTIVPVTAQGHPAGTAVMYDDRRGAGFLPAVETAGEALWRRLGYRMQATWGLPKLLALHASGALPDGARFAHQPDVVTAALASRLLPSDLSSALKSGADLDLVDWPAEVFERLSLPLDAVNEVALSGTVIGAVGETAAADTGLPAGCAIVAGFTDGCAAQIAAGALTPGSWNSVLGTTLVVKGAAKRRIADPSGSIYAHRAPFDGGWYPGGASSTGARAISAWLPGRDLDRLTSAALQVTDPPLMYPLVGRGERFPFVHDAATTVVEGAQSVADLPDPELFSGIAHGVAYLERLAYEHIAATGYATDGDLFLTGGGARNGWWNQLRADTLGRPVTVASRTEGAVGMALLAAAATEPERTADPLAAAAARMLPLGQVLDPQPSPRLEDGYARFTARLRAEGWLESEPTGAGRNP